MEDKIPDPMKNIDLKDLEKFLNKIDDVDNLVKGLSADKAGANEAADKFLIKHGHKPPSKDKTGINRTVINHAAFEDAQPQVGDSMSGPIDKDSFLKAVEQDAELRYQNKKIREKKATELKDAGNVEFKAGNYEKAIDFYTQALTEVKDMTALWTNRALAYNKIRKHEEALKDCEWAFRVFENCIKAYVQQGKAYLGLKQYDKARESYKQISKIDPKNESAVKEYILEVDLVEKTEIDDRSAEEAFTSGSIETTSIVEIIEKLNRTDQLTLYYSGGFRIICRNLINTTERTLFRTHGGFNFIEAHPMISRCFKSHIKSLSQEDKDLVWSLIDAYTAACTDNDENIKQTLEIKPFTDMIQLLLTVKRKSLKTSAVNFLHTVSQSELGRNKTVSTFNIPSLTSSVFDLMNTGGLLSVNAMGFLNNLALNQKYKSQLRPDIDGVFTAFENFIMTCDSTNSTLPLCLSSVTNLTNDTYIRQKVTHRSGCWKACLHLLSTRCTDSSSITCHKDTLFSLLGLLMNISVETSDSCVEAAPDIAPYCVTLLDCNHDDLQQRSLALLSHLLPKSQAAAVKIYTRDTLEKILSYSKSEDEKEVSYSIKIIAAFTQHVPASSQDIPDIKNGLGTIVELLKHCNELIIGNSALCLSNCCSEPKVCKRLVKTNIIQHLLVIVRDGRKLDVQKNAGILIAKLTQGDQRHLERLRELNGIEILHNIMKHVK